ncbi:MAG TPA: ATP-dependent DNA ligase [Ramlibacter sp.]|nr:ATP-dependent DNA ligase [Ramlibacter sp.]
MKRFSQLFAELDQTTSTNAKVEALTRYFDEAPPRDAAWAVYFLAGGKPRQVVPMGTLGALACEVAGIPEWLFGACYEQVGDLAETISLVLPLDGNATDLGLAQWIEERLLPLRGKPFEDVAPLIKSYWLELDAQGRFLLTKLIGGAFRVGVSKLLVQRALAAHAGVDAKRIAQRMMGYTDGKVLPSPQRYEALVSKIEDGEQDVRDAGQPYPFFLAHQLDLPPELFKPRLGAVDDWMVEWKYDGIRGQVIRREGQVWIWTRGEELATERFPEIVAAAQSLPDGTVIDGEILVWNEKDDRPAPFSLLQQRIGRKNLSKKILEDAPVSFMAYDILEHEGSDIRAIAQRERRTRLEGVLKDKPIRISPVETAPTWLEFARRRERSRELGVEGFMLKRMDASYGTGRTKAEGLWWKWKIEPMTIDCVLVYAQPGSGRRSSVHTDYTFAVWNRAPDGKHEVDAVIAKIVRMEPPVEGELQLVPFAKAYSGLTDEEFREVDAVIRKNTIEKFGPVRSVKPMLVFELGFEGINRSPRHRSGIAVRFPRMLRIRPDKPLHEANTLADLEVLLNL